MSFNPDLTASLSMNLFDYALLYIIQYIEKSGSSEKKGLV